MKFLTKILIISLIIFVFFPLSVAKIKQKISQTPKPAEVKLDLDEGRFEVKVGNKAKEFLKTQAQKIKRFIYREAGQHNPPGDALPDEIDDQLLDKLKKAVN